MIAPGAYAIRPYKVSTMQMPHNIYLHVPFCAQKCAYCAFYSVACAADWPAYADKMISEIEWWGKVIGQSEFPSCGGVPRSGGVVCEDIQHPERPPRLFCSLPLTKNPPLHRRGTCPTIFFGGGTPSLMPTDIFKKIMDAIRINFDIAPDAEITLESNPGTLDAARLREFAAAGINRLSIGVQSFDDAELKFLGRIHTATDAINLVRAAQHMGLRVSGDFIYALPNQSVAAVEKTCRGILDLGLTHASLYELSIEPGTPLAARGIKKIDNDLSAEMFDTIGAILSDRLPRYEVSNYAASGHECRHNQNIWAGDPYIGIGPSAAGRPFIDGVWYEQSNPANLKTWLIYPPTDALCASTPPKGEVMVESGLLPLWGESASASVAPREPVGGQLIAMSDRTRAVEKIITGLRTKRGVVVTPDVAAAIDLKFIEQNPDLFIRNHMNLSLSETGLLILDNILVHLIG